jgi:50S ribosomal protein L16 3-hydroxylase
MLNLQKLSLNEFLSEYWQKKPLVIRAALPNVKNPLTANELAGLAMDEEIESRLIIQTPGKLPEWILKRGPFAKSAFKKLPESHWTLLVQGVDRFIPEVTSLLDYFNFIPQWRIDDVMISYAVKQGSVGPHYDNYNVFLYQAQGRRKWSLTTHNCVESNYLPDAALRIMKEFKTEHEYILEEGDMLYLPPNIGHHGISLSDDCMTYSFGYRSYQGQELWDSFGDYLSTKKMTPIFYQDPPWTLLKETSQLPQQAWQQAKTVMQAMLEDDALLKDWFGIFATSLDQHAESLLPEDRSEDMTQFVNDLLASNGLTRNPLCRFAYLKSETTPLLSLYINGSKWCIDNISEDLIEKIANNRSLSLGDVLPFIDKVENKSFLYELWKLQWLDFLEKDSN